MKRELLLVLIVTYNRLSDLKICVETVRKQTYKYFNILVVNNGSTDGTKEWLVQQADIITINQENLGGAGGFYTGMKYMYDNGYEWLVMMDDDGIPDKNEIKNLIQSYDKVVSAVGKEVILNALVADKDDKDYTAFLWARSSRRTTKITELQKEQFFNDIHPFNGTLVKRSVIEKIGMIKKEMFIWGDEIEYFLRTKKNRFKIATVPSAVHLHPKSVNKNNYISFYNWKVPDVFGTRFICVHRNKGYIYSRYYGICGIIKYLIANTAIYVCNFQFKKWLLFIKYYFEGVFNYYK